ncbi:tetratricopeptide repeat protein [Zafaria sp. Z1313]|uniref:tetratricopeptide repeat protein n=1 Tax=unclassified Zafaria TaxID=2828765 RepID=UPI002E75D5E3|nr:tetratricopeptide repeat protein [Zafaria sp. J156]MEE1620444.1 tetratricopeptide repeat protein [Zafaria sp. J156]
MSALAGRLNGILSSPPPHPLSAPESARGWLELAYERAYAEDHAGAVAAAEAGLARHPGTPDPGILDTVLALWGIAASVRHMDGDDAGATAAAQRRLGLLRGAGRHAQADLEADLGPLLFREPEEPELPLLQAALATHQAAGAPPEVLADVRLPLAVVRFERGDPEAAAELEDCVDAYAAGGRTESQAGALLYLAHGYAKQGRPSDALRSAEQLLRLEANRAMRGAVWMVKATAHSELGHELEAEGCAVRALELYAGAGVRKGAVSAAALVANLASQSGDTEAAVLAWRIAVEQAERGEFDETWAVRLALGNQLLEAEEFLLAEEVLSSLAGSLEAVNRPADQARALMSLGHCLRHQERGAEALEAWARAERLFERNGEEGEASRAALTAGTLVSRDGDVRDALASFERAVGLARRAGEDDPGALPQALHALGHGLCETGDADGLAALEEAVMLADAHGAQWHAADFRDTRARSLWALGHGTEAVAAALEAADLFKEAGDPDASGNAELFAAHVLGGTGRNDEAVRLYRLTAAEHHESVAHVYAAQRGLADVLAAMGLPVQAREAREAAEQALRDAGVEAPGDGPEA